MGIKELWDKFQDYNKPENVKKRLKSSIEIERLRTEKEKLIEERKKANQKRWTIGEFK